MHDKALKTEQVNAQTLALACAGQLRHSTEELLFMQLHAPRERLDIPQFRHESILIPNVSFV
ncbi:hypothetical protein BM1_02211 [Bipolaris maydis]|nr:hypothetical protein BM1_02211 [Bipolaris maydis]